jgi:hypothetical protein
MAGSPGTGGARTGVRMRPRAYFWIALLLAASIAIRFAAALGLDAPWVAPDEMVYGMLGRSFWETGHMQVLHGFAPFYGLYPVVAGAPLAAFGPAAGLIVLEGFQAVLVTAAAAVAFVWARQFVSRPWALAAAAMTAALPGLANSGLIMTEAAFVPAATLALSLVARALAEPSYRNQALALAGIAVAIAMGLLGVVLLPALAASVGLMAWFSRDGQVVRRFWPTWCVLGAGFVLWAAISLAGSRVAGLGAYAEVRHGYTLGSVVRWVTLHAGDVLVLVACAPLVAALILAVEAARGRERDPRARALLAVTLAYGVLLVVEVGAFASQFDHHLVERDLTSVAPPLFVAFALWLGRGLPRPQPTTALVALAVLVPAVFWPARTLIRNSAGIDSLTLVPLLDLLDHTSTRTIEAAWIAGVAAAVVLVVFIPRRAGALLALLVIAALCGASVLAQRSIDDSAHVDRAKFFGTASPQWVERTADGPVAYVDDQTVYWNEAWSLAYWNPTIKTVAALAPVAGNRPDAVSVTPDQAGVLVDQQGRPLQERLVLARSSLAFVGVPLRSITQGGHLPGLTLWRTPSAPTLASMIRRPPKPGELLQPFRLTAPSCSARALELAVRGLSPGAQVIAQAGDLNAVAADLPAGRVTRIWVMRPRGGAGRPCTFAVAPQGTVRVVDLGLVAAPPDGAQLHRLGVGVTEVAMNGTVGTTALSPGSEQGSSFGYCLKGTFLELSPNQPATDPRYAGAVPANFVDGLGITCASPPAGYVQDGLAPASLGVPPGIYPYYHAP